MQHPSLSTPVLLHLACMPSAQITNKVLEQTNNRLTETKCVLEAEKQQREALLGRQGRANVSLAILPLVTLSSHSYSGFGMQHSSKLTYRQRGSCIPFLCVSYPLESCVPVHCSRSTTSLHALSSAAVSKTTAAGGAQTYLAAFPAAWQTSSRPPL
eukprot:scaffold13259_cov20-Tisochrysis_lutea.AAC.1